MVDQAKISNDTEIIEGERYSLEFNDIVYDVPNKNTGLTSNKYLRLIQGFSGKFESGKLTAIMGPSGSCKTTFLDLLVGRNQPGSKTAGEILFRGKERDPKAWGSKFAYLEQDDAIIPQQSVFEFIHFAISCRRHEHSDADNVELINEVMERLKISHLKDVKLDVISGGERKRVMIAIEFISEPEILILDEPTSGLDSNLSLQLIYMLREYAHDRNKIVLMTIHQPGSGLFGLIDDFFFVHKGVIMYSGPVKNIDHWLDEYGLTISNSLSKPEFLFELFTRNSVFPEVKAHDPTIVKMIEEKEKKVKEKYHNCKLSTGSDDTVSYGYNKRHITQIMKRAFTLSFRGFFPTLGMFLRIFVSIIFPLSSNFSLSMHLRSDTQKNQGAHLETNFTLKKLDETVKNAFGVDKNLVEKGFIHSKFASMLIIFFIPLSLFCNFAVFSNKRFVSREMAKNTYSIVSFYFAIICYELLIDSIQIVAFLSFSLITGFLTLFKTPLLILYIFLIVIFLRLVFSPFVVSTEGSKIASIIFFPFLVFAICFSQGIFLEFFIDNKNQITEVISYFRIFSLLNPIAYLSAWYENYNTKKLVKILGEIYKVNKDAPTQLFVMNRHSAPKTLGELIDKLKDKVKTCTTVSKMFFMIPFPSFLNIPLAILALTIPIVLSFMAIRLKFVRAYRLKLSR